MIEGNVRDCGIQIEGEVLFIDKPIDWTSFDVVRKVRTLFNIKKVGHAGTLDPKATGLLIVCTGKKTKNIENFMGLEKEYIGTCEIGIRTPSFDRETEVCEYKDPSEVDITRVLETAKGFFGRQLQIPPMYSAIKYGGIPLYQYARAGRTVERAEREIDILKFEIQNFYRPYIDFCIVCSKGTYIRSLINEFGQRLGCGAVLNTLRRMRIGEYKVENAKTLEQLAAWRDTCSEVYKSKNENSSIN
jgi:tRNA pseudouridine55 synthase